jgi:hypothetical protein
MHQGVLWDLANAEKAQPWNPVAVHLLVAILKKRLGLPQSLYTIPQALRVTLFEEAPRIHALRLVPDPTAESEDAKQVVLFDA